MLGRQIDPSRLVGDELAQWYRRSPTEIEAGRQAVRDQAYDAFFSRTSSAQAKSPNIRTPATDGGASDCVGCHGRIPPMLPFPFPAGRSPSLREGGSRPPSKPPERDRKQCEIQDQRDREICGLQPNSAAKRGCHESATARYSHCLKTGEVGWPDLFTVSPTPRP